MMGFLYAQSSCPFLPLRTKGIFLKNENQEQKGGKMKNLIDFNGLPLSTAHEITIGLDCDDLLFECASLAVQCANRDYGLNLDPENMLYWGYKEGGFDKVFQYFNSPSFVMNQKPIEGAQEFIRKLSEVPNVKIYFITAVPAELSGIRGECLKRYFPWIDEKNYILSSSKDVAKFDIFIDDAPHNIFANRSEYRIVRRHRWNENVSGMMSYSDFDELWSLIRIILKKKQRMDDIRREEPVVIALVGPTGGGKNRIADLLSQCGFARPRSYTTKQSALPDRYRIVSEEEFKQLRNDGMLMDSTVYGTHRFALPQGEIQKLLDEGKNVVSVVDMCGVASLMARFPCITIYKDKKYSDILMNIIDSDDNTQSKVNRIMSLSSEQANIELCNYMLPAEDTDEESAQRIINLIRSFHKKEKK